MKETIWALAAEQHASMQRHREHIHRHPELGFREQETSAYVARQLDALGIPYTHCEGNYGLVARLKGCGGGRQVGFRADMDALAMSEANDVPYRSEIPGVMHACGHDGHTAVLLGLAQTFATHPELLKGDAVLFFQPAEEQPPGGAKAMVEQGFADGLDYVFGMHFQGQTPTGTVKTVPGPIMALSDDITIRIHGRGAHAADPNLASDALLTAAHAVCAIQTIVSRMLDPLDNAVVSISSFHSGTDAHNILQSEAVLLGTVRCFREEVRDLIESKLHQVLGGVCAQFGTSYTLECEHGYPAVFNDPDAAALCMDSMRAIGIDVQLCKPDLGGEDFAYFLNHTPGCFTYVGCGNPACNAMAPVHTTNFDIDPMALDAMLACELSCYLSAQNV